jgi:Ca2+-binding EF-hand superfamily protein
MQFVHLLFIEIDQDGSGTIDKGEFRMMLRKLNLTYRLVPSNCAVHISVVLLLTR